MSAKKALFLIAAGAAIYWAYKVNSEDKPDWFDSFSPQTDLLKPITDAINSGWGFVKTGFADAGQVFEEAFDLANSDFKTSVTSGRGNQYVSEIEKYGRAKGLPPFFLSRIAYQESRFKESAKNPKSGAAGMFQFMPITVKEVTNQMGRTFDPMNWRQAAEAAALYFGYLFKVFNGNPQAAIAAYNWGLGNVKKHMAANGGKVVVEKLNDETRDYVIGVMADIYQD